MPCSRLYSKLHRLAENHLRRSSSQLTMGATTLLHDAYLNLSGGELTFVNMAENTIRAANSDSSLERLGHALDELARLDRNSASSSI
jgi:hypothetical protein